MKKHIFALTALFILAAGSLKAVAAEEETMQFGYCGDYAMALGSTDATVSTESAAIEIPEELAQSWAGAEITKVSIGYGVSTVKDVTVFFTESLDEPPFYTQHALMSVSGGWNTVNLDTPYIVGKKGFFVGYSTRVNFTTDRPIGIDNIETDNHYGDFVNTYNEWENVGRYLGSVCIRLGLKGEMLPQNDVEVTDILLPTLVESGTPFTAQIHVTNNGVKTVNDLEVSCVIDGMPIGVVPASILDGPIVSGAMGTVEIPDLASTAIGKNIAVNLTISKVNGKEDSTPIDNSVTGTYNSAPKVFRRNVVVEEFTGIWCGWCPMGIVGLAYMKEKYGDEGFIGIAVHGSDPMEVASYERFADIVTGGLYPSAYLDRKIFFLEPSSDWLEHYYLEAVANPTAAEIAVKAVYSEEDNILTATSTSQFSFDEEKADYAIAFVIKENGVGPYFQANSYPGSGEVLPGWSNNSTRVETYYEEVAREIDSTYGIEGSVPENITSFTPYTFSRELPLDNVEDISRCEVVAMLLDTATGEVVNAATTEIENVSAGVESIKDTADGIYRVFNLQGVKVLETKDASAIDSLPKGIYVINGKKILR